jgi:hypothetical protein
MNQSIGNFLLRRLQEAGIAEYRLASRRGMVAILQGIRGLGSMILKTSVDLERAKLIQSTLVATAAQREDKL